jgi:predicted esterase
MEGWMSGRTSGMRVGWRAAAIGAALVAAQAIGQTPVMFSAPGGGKLHAEVRPAYPTGTPRDPIDPARSSPMLRRLEGVLADLDDTQVRLLRGSLSNATIKPADADLSELWAVVHVQSAKGMASGFEIRRDSNGRWMARQGPTLDNAPRAATGIDPKRLFEVTRGWEMYRGDFESPEVLVRQQVTEVAQPLAASIVWFDKALLGKRFLRGRSTSLETTTRDLKDERIALRLPKDFDPRSRVGALVWVHAAGDIEPPQPIFAAADKLGLAVTSVALAGNERASSDRYQLMFDALQTLSERVQVDPSRVYVTGISGGGRVSGNLACCFPDVFAGGVPIVGFSVYENVPAGNGRWWQGSFDEPLPEMFKILKTRRLAPITGSGDFNREPIVAAAKILKRDHVPVKLFDVEGLGHQMPTAETFSEALEWVDEPGRTRRDESEKNGDAMLALITDDASAPDRLVELTRKHPWTKAAWIAAQRLGFAKIAQPR